MAGHKISRNKKMAPKQEGPYEIEEVPGLVTYQLKLPELWRIHKVIHTSCDHTERMRSMEKIIHDHCQT